MKIWNRDLVIDLGIRMLAVETEIVSEIAKDIKVEILRPSPKWAESFQRAFEAYRNLEDLSEKINSPPPSPSFLPNKKYYKFTTALAEVKAAVAQTRRWLENGIDEKRISILAPRMEDYWPCLSEYLENEGIKVQRPTRATFQTFPDVAHWLSELRVRSGSFKSGDIEICLFSEGKPITSHEKFKYFYEKIYDSNDLHRLKEVGEHFKFDGDISNVFSPSEFVSWSVQFWKNESSERLVKILDSIIRECPASIYMNGKEWIQHVEFLSSRFEEEIRPAQTNGIHCHDLHSVDFIHSTHVVMLGLTESAMKKIWQVGVLPKDVMSIHANIGFNLPIIEDSSLEFEARWLMEDEVKEVCLYTTMSRFDGGVEAPSRMWLEGVDEETNFVAVPNLTRWDELQNDILTAWQSPASNITPQTVFQHIQEDLGLKELPSFGVNHVKRISASTLEDYLKCPFIVASKKLFGLADKESMDLDLDPMTKGNLIHSVFEKLLEADISFQWTEEALAVLVEDIRISKKISVSDERLWQVIKRKYVKTAKRFLEFEKDWRTKFPQTKTIGREVKLEGYLSQDGTLNNTSDGITFKGSIDRVDTDTSGRVVIIDYKSSAHKFHHNSWVEKSKLQLGLYTMAMEAGLSSFGPKDVIGAIYYVAKDFNRDYGFLIEEEAGSLFEINNNMKHKISALEKNALLASLKDVSQKSISGIMAGRLGPAPNEVTDCFKCRWNQICRAPHLI